MWPSEIDSESKKLIPSLADPWEVGSLPRAGLPRPRARGFWFRQDGETTVIQATWNWAACDQESRFYAIDDVVAAHLGGGRQ
jgi:hypothetical protein